MAASAPKITETRLKNGLDVIVIPDRRAPVVTHMVWYRNGSADDPQGKSGIAHFLEHLMFKGTKKNPDGVFSDIVSELGGQENAFTSYDYTAYYQRVAKENLGRMMEIEADRMVNLVLSDKQVKPERNVVLEERKMRTDSDPESLLGEAMASSLFVHHPYGLPIIGWKHEIEGLNREDALSYYRRFYNPRNAILVVAGDVEPAEVIALANKTYGRVKSPGKAPVRTRPQEPEPHAARRVSLADPKVEQPMIQRMYLVPPHGKGGQGESFAIEVMTHILGSGSTSRLYRRLVHEKPVATHVGAWYMGDAVDQSRLAFYAIPREGVTLEALEAAVDAVIAECASEAVSESELQRAKTRLVADMIYAQDSQTTMARWYGAALALGGTTKDVRDWPKNIEAVTADQVKQAAAKWLALKRSVTGLLLPEVKKAA